VSSPLWKIEKETVKTPLAIGRKNGRRED